MAKLITFGLLLVATIFEASGDAVVRLGIASAAWPARLLLFLGGGALLFGYGFSVNLAPVDFGRVAGLYIAVLFVVWQIVNAIVFRATPTPPIVIGGALIILGGSIVTFWGR